MALFMILAPRALLTPIRPLHDTRVTSLPIEISCLISRFTNKFEELRILFQSKIEEQNSNVIYIQLQPKAKSTMLLIYGSIDLKD